MHITGKTKLLGLLGWPVSHSFSPAMHNAAAHAAGLDYVYTAIPLHPARIADGVRGLSALGYRGVNLTIPHKQAVIPLLDHVDEAARALGAVNTIVFDPVDNSAEMGTNVDNAGATIATGYNTDWLGFLYDLDGLNVPLEGRQCLVLGAGGSARAIVYALLKRKAHVHLFARRPEQSERLVQDIAPFFIHPHVETHLFTEIPHLSTESPLIVNTTPLGMTPNVDRSAWPDDRPMPPSSFVYDLVYTPAETKIMRQASAAGCGSANGLGMLLHQGAEAFKLWSGVQPDLEIMRKALPF